MMIVKKDLQVFDETNRILLRANDFIYILPHPMLQHQISNYTITFPNTDIISNQYTVIAHGCATLVFSYDKSGLHGKLFGPLTKSCAVGSYANQCDMLLIIEFQPAGLYAFTGVNQKELTDQIVSFEMINSTLNRLVLETLESANALNELISRLDRLLLGKLHADDPCAFRLAENMLLKAGGMITCKELSASVYYSERHLARMFEHHLGMSIKTFSRLVRINKAIRHMQSKSSNLSCVSFHAGFYDSSHFIHDFKSVCGMTPLQYRNNMSDFYNEIAKFHV